MGVVAIIQARMGSTRLPGKVVKEIEGKSLLEHLIERLRTAKKVNSIVVVTSRKAENQIIQEICRKNGIKCYMGSEEDVLRRYYEAAREEQANIIVRVTADNPLTDAEQIDRMIAHHLKTHADYTHNKHEKGVPFGAGAEVISFSALAKAHAEGKKPYEREHVTPFIIRHPNLFKIEVVDAPLPIRRPEIRITVDTAEDLELIRRIYKRLYKKGKTFKLAEVIRLLDENLQLKEVTPSID